MNKNIPLGWVYLMRNKSMPGIVKIGFTLDDPWERANQLSNSTAVPTPFTVVFVLKTPYPQEVETAAHQELFHFRVSPNREFFNTELLFTRADDGHEEVHEANEEQEDQYFILKMRGSARLVSAWKKCEQARREYERLRVWCMVQERDWEKEVA